MADLANKIILLTGAAGGFGAEFIRQLLQKGAQLILADINEAIVTDKASSVSGTHGKIICCTCIRAYLPKPHGG